MVTLRETVKTAIAGLGYYTGALGVVGWIGERLHGRGCAILTYHRVLCREEAAAEPDPGLVTTVETFRAHMECIAERYTPVPLSEAVARLGRGAPLPRRACAVTFDDGWRDNFRNAYPILREIGIPATIFVATSYVGTERPLWTRRAAHVIGEALRRGEARLVQDALDQDGPGLSSPAIGTSHGVKPIVSLLKRLPAGRRERIVSGIAAALGCASVGDSWLTWDELRHMSERGVAVGSHTRTHAILIAESPERVRDELAGSRADIETHVGAAPVAFCYPDGAWDERVEAMVRDTGYACACSTDPGMARAGGNPYHLPRIAADERMAQGVGRGFSPAMLTLQAMGGFRTVAGLRRDRHQVVEPERRGATGEGDEPADTLAAMERHR
ncbi:MAG: polysaccharide deacetylase family protein [Armatimonadota bacterium]|nr:MAG: polysaccharide deacetylase family protein [Armatimonadota bacterium]